MPIDWGTPSSPQKKKTGLFDRPVSSLGGLSQEQANTELTWLEQMMANKDAALPDYGDTLDAINKPINYAWPKIEGASQILDSAASWAKNKALSGDAASDWSLAANPMLAPILLPDMLMTDKNDEEEARVQNKAAFESIWRRSPESPLERGLVEPQLGDKVTAFWEPGALKTVTALGINMLNSPTNILGAAASAPAKIERAISDSPNLLMTMGRVPEALFTSPAAGTVFAPDIARGLVDSAEALGEAQTGKEYKEAGMALAMSALMGGLAAKGLKDTYLARSAKLSGRLTLADIMARNASISPDVAPQPINSVKARVTIAQERSRLLGASMAQEEVDLLSAIHGRLADAWEGDLQSGPVAAQRAVQDLQVKSSEAVDALSVGRHYMGMAWGEDMGPRLAAVAERLADRRRLTVLNKLASEGDQMAEVLAAEVSHRPVASLSGDTVEALIERRAWGILKESPEASVAKSLRLATTEVLSDVGKSLLGDIEAGNPDWANALRERILGENPLDMSANVVAKAADVDTKLKREALSVRRRASAPDVDEATHEQWDRVTETLARTWAAAKPERTEAQYYQGILDGQIKTNLLQDVGRVKGLLEAMAAPTKEEAVPALLKAYLPELRREDPAAAKALASAPLEKVVERFDQITDPRGIPKQADEFGIHDAVEGMVRFGTAAYDSSRKLVDASPAAREMFEPLVGKMPEKVAVAPSSPIEEVFGPSTIAAKDLVSVSKLSNKEAFDKLAGLRKTEMPVATGKTVGQWVESLFPNAMLVAKEARRAIFSPLFTVKSDLFAQGQKSGDFSALNALNRAMVNKMGAADNAKRIILRGTEKMDRFAPGSVIPTGSGIKGIWDRVKTVPDILPDVSYRHLLETEAYGRLAEHEYRKSQEAVAAGLPAVKQNTEVISNYIKAREHVKDLYAEGRIPVEVMDQINQDVDALTRWTWRAVIDPLESVGLLSKEEVGKIRAAATDPVSGRLVYAPISRLKKIIEEVSPGLMKEVEEAVGENVVDMFDMMDMTPEEAAQAAKVGAKPKKPIWRRESSLSDAAPQLSIIEASGHRAILAHAVAARQAIMNMVPDLYVRSLLPEGHELRVEAPTQRIAYAGKEDIVIDVHGTPVTLKANSEKAKKMKASGGDNIIAMYDGQKVPFYVDREYAKDLSLVSRQGAKYLSEVSNSVVYNAWKSHVAPMIRSIEKATEKLGRAFRTTTTGTVAFAIKEALRNPIGSAVRSQYKSDIVPFRNIVHGSIVGIMNKIGIQTDDTRIYQALKDAGYSQSSIAGDMSPESWMKLLHETAAVSASYTRDKTASELEATGGRFGAEAAQVFENLAATTGPTTIGRRAFAGVKDLLKIAAQVGDEGVRIDALVNEGRAILDEVMPRSGDTPEVAAAKMKKRDNEFLTNPEVYSEWVNSGREEEYWLLKERLRAGVAARESNLDFQNRGYAHATLNSLEPFTGVGFIEAEAHYWAFRKDPLKYSTKLGALVVLPAIYEGYRAAQDPTDDERSQLGVQNWIFYDGTHIPRPQGMLGAVSFAVRTMAKESFRKMQGEDPQGFATAANKIIGSFTEATPVVNWAARYDDVTGSVKGDVNRAISAVLPFGVDTAVEAKSDFDPYFGRKISPAYDLETREQQQYQPWFIEASRKINMSPFNVDYFLSGTTGGSGSVINLAYEKQQPGKESPLSQVGKKLFDPRPKEPLGYRSLSVQRIEGIFGQIARERKDLTAYENNRNSDGWKQYSAAHPYLTDDMMTGFIDSWRESQKARREAITGYRNSDLPQDVKDSSVYALELDMTTEAQQRLQFLKALGKYNQLLGE